MQPVQQCLPFFNFASIVSIYLQPSEMKQQLWKVERMQGGQGYGSMLLVTSQIGSNSYISFLEKGSITSFASESTFYPAACS